MIREAAFAKANLVLQIGRRLPDGMHPVCSLLASLDLADELVVEEKDGPPDEVSCPGVEGENLASAAVESFRHAVDGALPPLRLRIDKRIPVAAGLGGGSADAAAALRAMNELTGRPLRALELRALAAELGSDVPSQVEPGHALVSGVGDRVEPVALPELWLVLVPQRAGLLTADVYGEFDRLGGGREELDPGRLRSLTGSLEALVAAVENDLEPAALSLRPELERPLAGLREAGALAAAVTGSGPTVFGLFPDAAYAERAAAQIDGAIVAAGRRR
jgi:4-diphosphocytidyl-2-C-methyl-D-erythritol kinase